MKKVIGFFLSFIYITTIPVYAAGDISVYLNGEMMTFPQPPVIRDDRTLVPFRAIFEALGMDVEWDGEERRVTATNDETEITLLIGETEMTVNNETIVLDTPPVIINDYTLVPLRAVSEAAGAKVNWDGGERTVTITTANEELPFEEWAREVMRLTNAERKKAGLNPLKWNETLALFAEMHCEDMIERNFFSHVNPDGEDPFDRIKYFDIEYWSAGENIGAGQNSPKMVVEEWMNSETHRANILNPDFKSIGVSVLKGGSYGIYWVQEFAWLK